MNKSFILLTCFTSLAVVSSGQEQFTGIHMDNYGGTRCVSVQPAEIVDNRYQMYIGTAFSGLSSNNFRAVNLNTVLFPSADNQNFYHREHRGRGYDFRQFRTEFFSGMFEINHQNSIGYTLSMNQLNRVDGLPELWTLADYDDYLDMAVVNTAIDYKRWMYQRMTYNEHAFSYGRVIKEDSEHYLKAGISAKFINAGEGHYFMSKSGTIAFTDPNSPQFLINTADARFGISQQNQALINRTGGLGLDLGVVYEYRPNWNTFKYDMDGKTDIPRYDVNKYWFKAGVSITNLGFVRFAKDTSSYDFSASATPADASPLFNTPGVFDLANPIYDIQDSVLNKTGIAKSPDNKDRFNMSLPTALNLQFDYHIWKNFYASYAGTIPINIPGDASRASVNTFHAITPRYERPRWSIATPLCIRRNAIPTVGLVGRMSLGNFGFFVGSNSLNILVAVRKAYDINFFVGLNIGILHTVPSDIDEDKVSDKMDRCLHDPGTWVFKGCPDTDNDGIIDLEDNCIYDQGHEKTDGCPDRDEDGVIDVNDRCPDTWGLAVHHGCPDKDFDGVIDLADRCPDVPGIELNNGCPFENQGCCSDNDGDGISNLVDDCPEVSGSVYNKGCPIDSSTIGKVNFDKVKPTVDANHTNNQIKDTLAKGSTDVDKGKETEPKQIASLKDIPVMNTGNEMDKLMVYFDVDQSFLQTSYVNQINDLLLSTDYKDNAQIVFVVIGHTDNDGSDNYNLLLSKRRAETVKKHLMNKGVPENQIEVYYYGEWQPLFSDDNEEHKGINRRAEVKVMRKAK